MPTTSSPWASPSSPAGRRLLQAEPVTADDIPILDEAALALGAALVAVADAAPTPRTELAPVRSLVVAGRPSPAARRRHRSAARRVLAAAAVATTLAVGVLAVGSTAGLDRPAPAAPTAAPAAAPLALGRAAGAAVGAEAPPVAGGQVVVALIEPTAALAATPGVAASPTLAARLGGLVALAAEETAAG